MQEVEIKLNRNNGPLTYNVLLPGNWNELTGIQLLYIGKRWSLWTELIKNNISLQTEKAALFLQLIQNKNSRQIRKIAEVLSYTEDDADVNILETTSFLFDKLDLTKNLLPSVAIGPFNKLYGPGDRLKNISIDELSFAFHFYGMYNKTKDAKHLNSLFAVLYRPYDKTGIARGDVREPFNHHLIEANENRTKKVNESYKQAVLIFFIGCIEYMEKRFPFVFKRADEDELKKQGNSSLMGVIISVAGGKFGDFDKTKTQNAYVVLTELNSLLIPKKK